jgi:hypothetical protein
VGKDVRVMNAAHKLADYMYLSLIFCDLTSGMLRFCPELNGIPTLPRFG